MARGVNLVILLGNCGKDPELKYMSSGGAVVNINLATSESWKDKKTGQAQERTEWHRVIFFNRLAEIVGQYVRKGAKLYIEGSLRTRKWQDQSGQERYTTEIVAREMQMLDSRQESNQEALQYAAPDQAQGTPQQPPAQQAQPQQQAPGQPPPPGYDNFDDDILF